MVPTRLFLISLCTLSLALSIGCGTSEIVNQEPDSGSPPPPPPSDSGTRVKPDAGPPEDPGVIPSNMNNPNKDTDCDGLSDAEEFATVYPGGKHTDPQKADTDGDGLPDGFEVGRNTSVDPKCVLTLLDADPATKTSPVEKDT